MARLPYDNESFEKMAGIKYTLEEYNFFSSDRPEPFAEIQQVSSLAKVQKAYRIK